MLRQPRLVSLTLVVMALYAACCAMALGQSAGERPATVGELAARYDNSLYKASRSTAGPEGGRLSAVSLIAVPAPQPKMARKHDLVTIIIREESDFSSSGSTDLKKQSALDARLEEFARLSLNEMILRGGAQGSGTPPSFKWQTNRDFKGEGTVNRADTFSARITAEILDVKPNGTLVLQAAKRIKTDEEEQQFLLTGICRAEDITADNSVLSTQMFDLSLTKSHSGAVRDTTRRGWISKLLDVVNPF